MREYFRPYSMVIDGYDTALSAITLVDTAGDALDCNYIGVECSGVNNGFWRAALDLNTCATRVFGGFRGSSVDFDQSSASGWGTALSSTAGSLGFTTSAITGAYNSMSIGTVAEFLLSDADRRSKIYLQQSEATNNIYYITYGQVQTGNPLRDGERPIGD